MAVSSFLKRGLGSTLWLLGDTLTVARTRLRGAGVHPCSWHREEQNQEHSPLAVGVPALGSMSLVS